MSVSVEHRIAGCAGIKHCTSNCGSAIVCFESCCVMVDNVPWQNFLANEMLG